VDTTDSVTAGVVASLARPGGYATRSTQFEFGMSGKWLEVLKERWGDAGAGQFGANQAVAPSVKVETSPIYGRDSSKIEYATAAFSGKPSGGLID